MKVKTEEVTSSVTEGETLTRPDSQLPPPEEDV